MAWLKAIAVLGVVLALVLVGVILAVDNHTPIALRFLNQETPHLAVFWLLYAAFLSGTLVGFALCSFGFVRGKLGERRLKRTLADRGRELAQLRNRPKNASEAPPHEEQRAAASV